MKSMKILFVAALIFSLLALSSFAYAGCPLADRTAGVTSAKSKAVGAAMEAAAAVQALDANVTALEQAANAEGCFENQTCVSNLKDLLKQINAQADQIEAQIPEMRKGFTNPVFVEKIDKLKSYVDSLRAKATSVSQKIM